MTSIARSNSSLGSAFARFNRHFAMAHRYAASDDSPSTPDDIAFDRVRSLSIADVNDENDPTRARSGEPLAASSRKREPAAVSPLSRARSGETSNANANDFIYARVRGLTSSVRALSDVGVGVDLGRARETRRANAPSARERARDSYVPEGVDERSYLVGQKDALMCAYEGALPQRELLGALSLALADVRRECDELRAARETTSIDVAVLGGRSRAMECAMKELSRALPAIERAIGALEARMDIAERARRATWGDVVRAALAYAYRGCATKMRRAERTTGRVAKGILFPNSTGEDEERANASGSFESALGAAMFVFATEIVFAANAWGQAKLPARFHNRVTATVTKGLEISRVIVWASAFVHGMTKLKEETAFAATIACAAFASKPPTANAAVASETRIACDVADVDSRGDTATAGER